MNEILCPKCQRSGAVKHGHIASGGKQNWLCRACGRQFVANPSRRSMNDAGKGVARALLKERVSLRGIARVLQVSPGQVLRFFEAEAEELPDDLNFDPTRAGPIVFYAVDISSATNSGASWAAGPTNSGSGLRWVPTPASPSPSTSVTAARREHEACGTPCLPPTGRRPLVYTDLWEAYRPVIPARQHVASDKGSGFASYIERFNCTLRQRASRLVRKALSFSKKLANHIAAIELFVCGSTTLPWMLINLGVDES